MKAATKAAAALVAAVTAGAAAAPIPAAQPELTFRYEQSPSDETAHSARGGERSIDFAGSLTSATPCVTLDAEHEAHEGHVVVRVTATGTGDICAQVITHNNYRGSVGGLDAGTYTFEVVHVTDGRYERVFSEEVTVR